MEAIRLGEEQSSRIGWRLSDLGDPARRRRVAKQVFYRLPCRPLIAFLGLYLLRGGFLDGWAGLQYCRPRSMYEYMIALKMHERRFLAAARRT